MMSRDFLARIEGLKIQIKPDIMKEVNEQLALWPEDRGLAYVSDLAQVIRDQTGSSLQRAIDKMNAGEKPDQQDKRLADAVSSFALAMLRVYQIEDLRAAQSEDDHEAQG